MPSPFPGMDPYLEDPAFWSDFHLRYINYLCEAIADRLPDAYEASIDERVVLEEHPGTRPRRKLIEPDVAIVQDRPASPGRPASAVATSEPVTIPLLILDKPKQRYLKILQGPDRILVAVLELLSPSNKAGPDRGAYLAKRDALLHQDVHLVELDLLFRGRRLPMDAPLPPGDYYAFVSRAERRPDCNVYAWTVRQPLPTLPIPLKAPDPDIMIDLGAVFATAYERGRYARRVAYEGPPPASLVGADRDWAQERARSMRP